MIEEIDPVVPSHHSLLLYYRGLRWGLKQGELRVRLILATCPSEEIKNTLGWMEKSSMYTNCRFVFLCLHVLLYKPYGAVREDLLVLCETISKAVLNIFTLALAVG